MINQNKTLQSMIESKVTKQDFESCDGDTHGIIKIIVSATLKERAYDFINLMVHESRRQYTMDLFEKIETTPWYDFAQPDGSRFILVWQLETVADEEEIIEYFSECIQEFNQNFGDVIVEGTFKETPEKAVRLITHDGDIQTFMINNE